MVERDGGGGEGLVQYRELQPRLLAAKVDAAERRWMELESVAFHTVGK